MVKKLGRTRILGAVIAVFLVVVASLAFFYSELGMAKTIGFPEPPLSESEYATLPQSVISDATALASGMVGKNQDRLKSLIDQILSNYVETRNSDVVILFNSGGWGWNQVDHSPGWSSIVDAIRSKLKELGYKSLVLNYQRTSKGLRGCVKEFVAALTRYPDKARELAERTEFLTDHIPDLRVIIAGESTGTVISDKTMDILRDNPRVYSIQTGTPFWHKPVSSVRTLLMNSNGRDIDTFSYGNISAMLWATFKSWFSFSSAQDAPGNILSWLRAPGHDYSWQYPGVSSEIIKFLDKNFGMKN